MLISLHNIAPREASKYYFTIVHVQIYKFTNYKLNHSQQKYNLSKNSSIYKVKL